MPKVNEKQGFMEVTNTVLNKKRRKVSKIQVRPFATDTANVSVKYGATIPMGDFSSARVDVMISMPCYVEEIGAVYKELRDTVSGLVSKEMDIITGGAEDGKED